MLGAFCANGCGRRIRHSGTGRPPSYCSFGCRRSAEYAQRRKLRTFEHYREGFQALGEAEVRRLLAEDPAFGEQLQELTETYLPLPDGRVRAVDDTEAVALLVRRPRSFGVIGHDSPLPSSADIDEAEESGDWWPMVKAALRDMTWQVANGFVPDLSAWEVAA